MNEFEENVYKEIKNELIQSVIEKKVDTYFVNKNELTHYYNVGKMIVDAQGGEERAKYGDGLIKNISKRLLQDGTNGFSIQNLKNMRRFYLIFSKRQALPVQISWSHCVELLVLKDINEINYYIDVCINQKIGYRKLHDKIKNKEYQRLNDKTKNKLINKEKTDIYDLIKNPITINTFSDKKEDISERVLKSYILKDLDNFLEQLGQGFSYIKNEYKIIIGNKTNFIDLLLVNYIYNCYVVVELKVIESKKDHLGQIQVYMNYIDKHVKTTNQEKTIGIIVCKKDDKYLIEYSSDERIRITYNASQIIFSKLFSCIIINSCFLAISKMAKKVTTTYSLVLISNKSKKAILLVFLNFSLILTMRSSTLNSFFVTLVLTGFSFSILSKNFSKALTKSSNETLSICIFLSSD